MRDLRKTLLKWRIEENHLTQQQAADAAGTRRQYWSFCETGRFDSVPIADKFKIARTVGADPGELWGVYLYTPFNRKKLGMDVEVIDG
jgi:DNA-binding XRE family transcriptional regulator